MASTSPGCYQQPHKQSLSNQNGTTDAVAATYSANSNLMNGAYSNLDLNGSAGGGSTSINNQTNMQTNNSTVNSNLSAITTPSLNVINPKAVKFMADYKQIDLELSTIPKKKTFCSNQPSYKVFIILFFRSRGAKLRCHPFRNLPNRVEATFYSKEIEL